MNRFIALTQFLQQERDSLVRQNELSLYFSNLDHGDFLWALALFSGKKLFKRIPSSKLLASARDFFDFPDWLIEECITVTGDPAEALSKLLAPSEPDLETLSLRDCLTTVIQAVEEESAIRLGILHHLWNKLPEAGIGIINQVITDRFPHRFSDHELGKAIANAFGVDSHFIQYNLSQNWSHYSNTLEDLVYKDESQERLLRPCPFHPLSVLPNVSHVDFTKEWVACLWQSQPQIQLIRRGEVVSVWDENGELLNNDFPSLVKACRKMPSGSVVSGQIWQKDLALAVMAGSTTNQEIERNASPGPLFVAHDVLEWDGLDISRAPLETRLGYLAEWLNANSLLNPKWALNGLSTIGSPSELENYLLFAREMKCPGLLIRELRSGSSGSCSGFLVPAGKFVFSGLLIYAQETTVQSVERQLELSFGAAHEGSVLSVTKVQLRKKEQPDLFQIIKQFVAGNTIERFGPVRKLKPMLVFEISFESIRNSNRHKSGFVLLNPQIVRMEPDKLASEIHQLEELKRLL